MTEQLLEELLGPPRSPSGPWRQHFPPPSTEPKPDNPEFDTGKWELLLRERHEVKAPRYMGLNLELIGSSLFGKKSAGAAPPPLLPPPPTAPPFRPFMR